MPLLQVRNFPEDTYELLKFYARQEHRTIAQQTIVLLKRGLGDIKENKEENIEKNRERRRRIFEEIKKNDIPEELKKLDIVKMIREDRDR